MYIINCVEDTLPYYSNKNVDIEEERRLFYVGITRAIDNLYLFSPRNRRGQSKEVSRFIVEGKLNDIPIETYGFEVGNKIIHRSYGVGEIEELKEDKITISFENILRSFSTKVLINNNLIEKL